MNIRKVIQNTLTETPYFIIDSREIYDLYNLWNRHLPRVQPHYAIKCNPNTQMLTIMSSLCREGEGSQSLDATASFYQGNRGFLCFDCASKSEIQKILSITRDPRRIIYANPCKSPSDLRFARENNVKRMTFDCMEELYKIKRIFPNAELLLRIAVDDSKSKCSFNKKFGCLKQDIERIIIAVSQEQMSLIGFSFHLGSDCLDPHSYYRALNDCKWAYDVAQRQGITVKIIDIGGGMRKHRFAEMAESINRGIDDFFSNLPTTLEFIAEPGRFFAETTHTLVIEVIGKKIRYNQPPIYYVNEGVYGSFNCIKNDHYCPQLISLIDGPRQQSIVFGPTCDSIDIISEDAMLPPLEIGDYLYVENFGAYTVSASSTFNGFSLPTNVLV
jgi:ornithine decarboxylase